MTLLQKRNGARSDMAVEAILDGLLRQKVS